MKKCMIVVILSTVLCEPLVSLAKQNERPIHERIGIDRGVCAILGDTDCEAALMLARETDLMIYVQLQDDAAVQAASRKVDSAGFYGRRIWIAKGPSTKVHLGDNLVDALVVVGEEVRNLPQTEALRVLCPLGRAFLGKEVLIKPLIKGTDDWSHPYHGPDNNPQSKDTIARAPYLTQFLAEPYYGPLTQVAVASAGRVFKAFGNIAFKVREESLLNTLVAFNGYNGTILWKRELTPGVMVHRNTIIATPNSLYLGDDKSCKVIDTQTGRLKDEIVPSTEVAGGTFWKWMALEDGVMYALIGEQEQKDPVTRQRRSKHGWPWMPLSKGFNQTQHPWGFGQNVLAIDPESKRVLWSYREEEKIDGRSMCMKNGRIYFYGHRTFLVCLDAKTGKTIWRKTPDNDPKLFESFGKYLSRQGARTNWRTTSSVKCSDKALYFAGPAIDKLLALSTDDATILWEHPYNNFQLVLRDEGLYGISGAWDKHPSMKFDPLTGKLLSTFDTRRISCTRPNGTTDAIIYRALGGSVRLDIVSNTPQWISPMRAQCHDGVTIANGFLYWWPSVCDCHNNLLGVTCLGPAGDFDFSPKAIEAERLEIVSGSIKKVADLPQSFADWPTFRANNIGTATSEVTVAKETTLLWWSTPDVTFTPTAPVIVGDVAFVGGSDGIVRALDMTTGEIRWKACTGGFIRFSPTVWKGRLFVGSGDGWMYTFEAATGRLLWRFRAAPLERRMPVYGLLMSTWPVASGVLVDDGIAYFAAGIVNYDGTHVYALDAVTGKIKWQNNTSGHLYAEARTGVSVQGHMLIRDGKLYLAGGNAISPAIYDINNGKCLNDPERLKLCIATSIRGQELYKLGDKIAVGGMPLYRDPDSPVYNKTVTEKVLHTSGNGRDVLWIDNKKIMCFEPLDTELLNACVSSPDKEFTLGLRALATFNIEKKPLWKKDCEGSVAFVRCKNVILYAGTAPYGNEGEPCIRALDIETGEEIWKQPKTVVSSPVAWGMAVDAQSRIVSALKDGQVMCYGPTPKSVARIP